MIVFYQQYAQFSVFSTIFQRKSLLLLFEKRSLEAHCLGCNYEICFYGPFFKTAIYFSHLEISSMFTQTLFLS